MDYKYYLEEVKDLLWSTWETKEIGSNDFKLIKEKLLQLYKQTKDSECLAIISELHIHKSNSHKRQSRDFALEGLKENCNDTFLHGNYTIASNGAWRDFIKINHNFLIEFYKEFIKNHPEVFIARVILIENLIDNYRFDEAHEEIDKACKLSDERVHLLEIYKGEILYKKGKHDEAIELWNQTCKNNPEKYKCYMSVGNQFASFARYEEAIEYYKKSFLIQVAPRKLDALLAIVSVYEILKNYEEALRFTNLIIKAYETDYNVLDGEELRPYLANKERFEKIIKLEK
ncbi:MAG: hypothetical protein RR942_17870 [Romboutsia sp.]